MATETLTATLKANDRLSGALREVASSARTAARGLESVDDQLINIAESSSLAQEGLQEVGSELQGIIGEGGAAQTSMDQVSDELSEISRNTAMTNQMLGQLSSDLAVVAGAAAAGSISLDELGDEAKQSAKSMLGLSAANLQEAGSAAVAGASTEKAAESVDDLGDEAREAATGMFAASGAADALSLSSSALSINVGFMTIALRNLTTQVPLLVTSLGGLSTAFIGVASAAGLAAAGVGSVLAAGFLAQAQQLSDELGSTVSTMEAMQGIGQEIKRMMLEAIEPLLQAEGVVQAFKDAMEGLAATVQMFSGALAASFSNAEEEFFTIAEFMDIVGAAWMDNLRSITEGFMTLWTNIGPIFADGLVFLMENFKDFTEFVSEITLDLITVFDAAGGGLTDFLGNLIRLGVEIAAGLAPIISGFITIMGDAAAALDGGASSAIGTAVQIAALLLVVNKLAGALGALLAPFTAGIASIIKMRSVTESFGEALVRTTDNFLGFMKTHISGFGALSKALGVFIDTGDDAESALDALGNSIQRAGGLTPLLANKLGLASIRTRIFGEAVEEADDDLSALNVSMSAVRRKAGALAGTIASSLLPATTRMKDIEMPGRTGASVVEVDTRFGKLVDTVTGAPGRMRGAMSDIASAATTTMAQGFDSATNSIATALGTVSGRFSRLSRNLASAGGFRSFISGPASSLMESLGSMRKRLGRGLVNAAFRANMAMFSLGDTMSELDSKGGSLISGALDGMWRGLVRVKNAAIQAAIAFGQLFTAGFIGFMKAYSTLFFGMLDGLVKVGGAATTAASKLMFFGESMRALATGGMTDRFKQNFMDAFDISALDLGGKDFGGLIRGGDRISEDMAPDRGLVRSLFKQRILGGIRGAIPDIRGSIPSLGDVSERLMGGLSNAAQGVSNRLFTLAQGFENVSAASIKSRLSFSGLRDTMASVIPTSFGLSGAMTTLMTKFRATRIAALLNSMSFRQMAASMALSGGVTGALGSAMIGLANIAGGVTSVTGALSGAITTLAGVESGASAATIALGIAEQFASAGATTLTAALSVLASILGGVAIAAGALVAALGAIVVVGGAVALMLGKLGSSGKSADDIISGLMDRLRTIADSVMPVFIASANMLQDIFVSIAAPVQQLIGGFQDIAIALGFMDEKVGQGQSGFETFMNALDGLVGLIMPVISWVSQMSRVIGNDLAVGIRDAMDMLQEFLVAISAGDKIRAYIDMIKSVINQVMGLEDTFRSFIDGILGSFQNTFGTLIDTVQSVMSTFKEAFGLGGDGGGDSIFNSLINAVRGFYSFLISLVGPILDLLGSIMGALFGLADVLIKVLGGAIKVVIGIVAGLMDFMNDLLGVFGTDLSGIFNTAVSGAQTLASWLGPLISFVADIIDAFVVWGEMAFGIMAEVAGVIGAFLAPVFDMLANIILGIARIVKLVFDTIVGIVMGTLDFIVGYFSTIFTAIGQLMSGNIMGAINTIISFIISSFTGILQFVGSIFGRLGQIIIDTIGNALNIVADFIMNLPSIFMDAFTGIGNAIANAIAGPWNEYIAGDLFTISVPGWVPEIGGSSWSLSIPEIGGGDLPTGGGGGGGSGSPPSQGAQDDLVADTDDIDQGDLGAGTDVLGDVAGRAAETAGLAGQGGKVEYNENNAINNTTNVDAQPEDKGTISRVVKDAMEEANSFERRRQGHTGG